MELLDIIVVLITSTILIAWAGYIAIRSKKSAALIFMILLMLFVAAGNALIPMLVNALPSNAGIYAKLSGMFFTLTLIAIVFLVLVFPYNYALIASARRKRIYFSAYIITSLIFGIFMFIITDAVQVGTDYWFDNNSTIAIYAMILIILPFAASADYLIYKTTEISKSTVKFTAAAIVAFLAVCLISTLLGGGPDSWLIINFGIIIGVGLIAYMFTATKFLMVTPVQEVSSVSSKSMYKLLSSRLYVVEEKRPHFVFELFSEILRRRCYDCMNDESFVCESLDCRQCKLPCPCRECKQHLSRTQGLIITRRHPIDVRMEYMIQTTPIIWLTSIPGKDNIDPSKLSLLTDMIINFIEKSQNGLVLVEGIEYLITANDFVRVLRAIDRWSEVVMSNSSRLIISLNPKAFDPKELALIERNREIIRLHDKASIERILATSST